MIGLTTVLFLSATLYTNAGEPLAIVVSPVLSIAPANVVIRVRIAPDAANRTLEVVTESDTAIEEVAFNSTATRHRE